MQSWLTKCYKNQCEQTIYCLNSEGATCLCQVFEQADFYTNAKVGKGVAYGRKTGGKVDWKIEDSKVRTEGKMKHVLSA